MIKVISTAFIIIIIIITVFLFRMKKLKEEMEGVVKELAENNHFLERSDERSEKFI